MFWRVLLSFSFCHGAIGASRVIVTTQEPRQIFVDGMMVPNSIGTIRTAIPNIGAGEHTIAVHGLNGALLHGEKILVPDGADVRVQYIPGAAFVIAGATVSGGSAENIRAANQVAGAAGIGGASQNTTAQSQPRAGSRSPSTAEVISGAGMTGSRASSLQRVMASPTPANILTNSARGLHAMTAGAQAGVSFGKAPVVAQRIKRANVVYGEAVFQKASGASLLIYEDGHLIAHLGPGAASARVKLEVGRRPLEVRSGEDYRVLFRGDLEVDARHIEQLNMSATSPPTATVRPWLWSNY
jgi:hypothetical protein